MKSGFQLFILRLRANKKDLKGLNGDLYHSKYFGNFFKSAILINT